MKLSINHLSNYFIQVSSQFCQTLYKFISQNIYIFPQSFSLSNHFFPNPKTQKLYVFSNYAPYSQIPFSHTIFPNNIPIPQQIDSIHEFVNTQIITHRQKINISKHHNLLYLYSLANKLVHFPHHLFLDTIYFVSPTLFPLASS